MYAKSLKAGLCAAVGATLLTGCASMKADSVTVGSIPDDYRTRHPIVVSQKEQTLDVAISTNTRSLDTATRSNVTAFAQSFAAESGGTIVMLEPAGAPNTHAVMGVRDELISAITAGGANRHQVVVQTYDASGHGVAAPVRLSYIGVAATTPSQCGRWIENLADNPDNRQYHNFGCATQANLAAIIANPNDLLGPRAMTSVDAAQRGNVITTWQEGTTQPASEVTF